MVHSQTTPASPSAIWSARSPLIAILWARKWPGTQTLKEFVFRSRSAIRSQAAPGPSSGTAPRLRPAELVKFTPTGKPLVDNKTSEIGAAHVCFKIDNLDGLYQKLVSHGVRMHYPPQHVGFGSVTYFRDPDGIILEAAQDD